jgi:N-methylhydantoinase A
VVLDNEGTTRLLKTPTTLDEPAVGVYNALTLAERELDLPAGSLLGEVGYFGLGTTVATNTLIERTGVRTGIITTRGFRNTVLTQRGMGAWAGREPHEIAHYAQRRNPEPIVPWELIEEVTERVDYRGAILAPLDEDDVRRAVRSR